MDAGPRSYGVARLREGFRKIGRGLNARSLSKKIKNSLSEKNVLTRIGAARAPAGHTACAATGRMVLAEIIERADGIPLFVEEITMAF
jgi:hypothetical protein